MQDMLSSLGRIRKKSSGVGGFNFGCFVFFAVFGGEQTTHIQTPKSRSKDQGPLK